MQGLYFLFHSGVVPVEENNLLFLRHVTTHFSYIVTGIDGVNDKGGDIRLVTHFTNKGDKVGLRRLQINPVEFHSHSSAPPVRLEPLESIDIVLRDIISVGPTDDISEINFETHGTKDLILAGLMELGQELARDPRILHQFLDGRPTGEVPSDRLVSTLESLFGDTLFSFVPNNNPDVEKLVHLEKTVHSISCQLSGSGLCLAQVPC